MKRQNRKAIRPSKDEIQSSLSISIRKIEAWETIGRYFIVSAAVVGFAYFGIYMPVEASAGQETTISYAAKFITDLKVDVALAWTLATGASAWAYWERKAKMKERREKDRRIADLEKHIDSKRSTSGLDVAGDKRVEHRT